MKSGFYRCKNHGGFSTGPTSDAGKLKAMRNLVSMKNKTDDEIRKILGSNIRTVAARHTTNKNMQAERYARTNNSFPNERVQ